MVPAGTSVPSRRARKRSARATCSSRVASRAARCERR